LILSVHAQGNIVKRDLDMRWVEQTVAAPELTAPDSADPTVTRAWRAIPERGGKMLRVAYRPVNGDILVITAFFDRGARR